MTFELPDLEYDYSDLEPHLDSTTMEIHHSKHHAGYTTKLNAALSGSSDEGKSINEVLENIESLQHLQTFITLKQEILKKYESKKAIEQLENLTF